jgi:hypothetical protein
MTEKDVYETVLQRAGWALPRPFLYMHLFFKNKKVLLKSVSFHSCHHVSSSLYSKWLLFGSTEETLSNEKCSWWAGHLSLLGPSNVFVQNLSLNIFCEIKSYTLIKLHQQRTFSNAIQVL